MKIKDEKHLDECLMACAGYMIGDAFAKLDTKEFTRSRIYRQKTPQGGNVTVKASVNKLKTRQNFTLNIKLTDKIGG